MGFFQTVNKINSTISGFNETLSTAKQNNVYLENFSENTQEASVASIRSGDKLGFSDLEFSFPVTDKLSGIRLPAFLTSHNDTFSPSWNPQTVYGRADPIPIYRNTTRSISLGFKIPNFNIEDANANFRSLGVLVKNLYPAYKSFGSADIAGAFRDAVSGLSPNQSIVGAPLTRIKFANIICNSDNPDYGLLGYITSLNITIDVQSGFLIHKDSNNNQSLLFPRAVNFSISFSPLHEHKIGWGTSNNWLGKNKDNFPYRTFSDSTVLQKSDSSNIVGAAVSGDSSGVIRAIFGS
jgi:hypothetical protein